MQEGRSFVKEFQVFFGGDIECIIESDAHPLDQLYVLNLQLGYAVSSIRVDLALYLDELGTVACLRCGRDDHVLQFCLHLVIALHDQFIHRLLDFLDYLLRTFQQVALEFAGVHIDHVHADEGRDIFHHLVVDIRVFLQGYRIFSSVVSSIEDPLVDDSVLDQQVLEAIEHLQGFSNVV